MANVKLIRNVCFLLGVLAALLCVFPLPGFDAMPEVISNSQKDMPVQPEVVEEERERPVSGLEEPQDNEVEQLEGVEKDTDTGGTILQQSQSRELSDVKYVEITMDLDSGHIYYFKIDPVEPRLEETASKFCIDHAAEIGVDEINMQHGCVDPVQQFLTTQVNSVQGSTEDKPEMLSVDLDIGGSNVNFDIDASNPDSAHNSANIFCTQYGAQFGVTDETLPLCIQNVQDALEQRISVLRETSSDSSSVVVEEVFVEQDEAVDMNTDSTQINDQVFVTSFPLGSKDFDYKYVMSVDATTNAATFCHAFWSELEGAFEEAGIMSVDEDLCAVIVSEVTLGKVQQFRETLTNV